MKTTLTLEIEYEVDGEMPPLEQVLTEMSMAIQESIPGVLAYNDYTVAVNSTQELPSGWIPCDANNLPPTEIPDGMWMMLWSTNERRIEPGPILAYGGWRFFGVSGVDFTHYLLVEKPDSVK